MSHPVLRVARPTDDIDALVPFYRALGLRVLSRFEGHGIFDGAIMGAEAAPWHLEFTRAEGHAAPRARSPDDLLVLYLPDADEWRAATERMEAAGHAPVPSFNPYWDVRGRTYEDADGFRVVLARMAWTL